MTHADYGHQTCPLLPEPGPLAIAPDCTVAEATACGKAIIVGEHAVVYGARAVAMPLTSARLGVRLTRTNAWHDDGRPVIRVTLGGRCVSDNLSGVVYEALSLLGTEPFPMNLEGSSSILVGAGMGSSASLCIVILRVLARTLNVSLRTTELALFGNQLEKRFHGNPSGLDTSVVAHEQIIGFRKGEQAVPLDVTRPLTADGRREPWRFALIDSGARSSTMTMIQVAKSYFTGTDGRQVLLDFDAIAETARAALAEGSTAGLAEAMNAAGAHLDRAGVTGDALHAVAELARAAGCPAVKPTGAGGGGCVIALLSPDHHEQQLTSLRQAAGANRVTAMEIG